MNFESELFIKASCSRLRSFVHHVVRDVNCLFFQGVEYRQTNFSLSCAIPLWDSATAHSPSGKERNPYYQEDGRFSGCCTLTYNFISSCVIPLWDSATAHSPSGEERNPSSLEE